MVNDACVHDHPVALEKLCLSIATLVYSLGLSHLSWTLGQGQQFKNQKILLNRT